MAVQAAHGMRSTVMERSTATTVAAAVAVLVSLPIALLLAGFLLPGDPDDPNTKAIIFGLAAALPCWGLGAAVYSLTRVQPELAALVRHHLPGFVGIIVGALLLIISVLVWSATPVPETEAQASGDPHFWRPSAYRLALAAAVVWLGAFGRVRISRPRPSTRTLPDGTPRRRCRHGSDSDS